MGSKNAFREVFRLPNKINWYASQIQGLRHLQERMRSVNCIVEMHDARIPISGRNILFHDSITSGATPHILLLNKSDLTDSCDHCHIASLVEQKNLLQHALFTSCSSDKCKADECLLSYLQALALRSRLDRFNVMLFGIPNVGKRTLIDLFKRRRLDKRSNPDEYIKISEQPDIYLASCPGILQPRILSDEMGLRLALVGCIPEEKVGVDIMTDYLLYWFNKNNHFHYVAKLGCKLRSDNIKEVLTTVAEKERMFCRISLQNGKSITVPNLEWASKRLLKLFRTGELGAINLDIAGI